MGARQSTAGAPGVGGSVSSSPRLNGAGSAGSGAGPSGGRHENGHQGATGRSAAASSVATRSMSGPGDWRLRARSLSNVINGPGVPGTSSGVMSGLPQFPGSSPDSDTSSEALDISVFNRVIPASLPIHLVPFNGLFTSPHPTRLIFSRAEIKCPVCRRTVLPDDVECHLVMCLTKPRISYNGMSLSSI